MILTCPECGTQYVVKDGAIPPEGRQVRCAACKHSWHQDPEESEATESQAPAEPQPAAEAVEPAEAAYDPSTAEAAAPERAGEDDYDAPSDESFAAASLIEPRSGPELEERAFEEAAIESEAATPVAADVPGQGGAYAPAAASADEAPLTEAGDWSEPPLPEVQDDEFSPFPAADESEPERRSRLLPILILALVVIAIAAAFWFLAPADIKAKLGLAAAGATPLAAVITHMDRQRLESGNELLTVTGRVVNPSGSDQTVPALNAQLKSRAGKLVYSWTIAPPVQTLPPGGTASFNSAEVNVPPGGDDLTITVGADAS